MHIITSLHTTYLDKAILHLYGLSASFFKKRTPLFGALLLLLLNKKNGEDLLLVDLSPCKINWIPQLFPLYSETLIQARKKYLTIPVA